MPKVTESTTILTADEVAEIHNEWGGSVYEGAILRLCASHEVLRKENTRLLGRIKRREDVLEHVAAKKALEVERDAMLSVARRLRDGWTPEAGASLLEFFTPAERAALDVIEADDLSDD